MKNKEPEKLNVRDVIALETYFGSSSTSVYRRFEEIGEQFSATSERGRQIFEKAVLKMYNLKQNYKK